ncbi:spindle assembly abnormal protein 7-like [Clytia hemisphaerica]|uniref:EF-hand domain-containing protein n=1 Tax=Clytia hemisphaerica TaxID=252671 RepID=A0A7M5UMR2_9CNID
MTTKSVRQVSIDENNEELFQGPGWKHLKTSVENLRQNFTVLCDSLEVIFNLENTKLIATGRVEIPDTSRRILGKEKQFVEKFREKLDAVKCVVIEAGDNAPEYASLYMSLNEHVQNAIKTLCTEVKAQLIIKSKSTEEILAENQKMMLDLQKKDKELMEELKRNETVLVEKRTLTARCKVLEQQIDEKNTRIQQLQKESTVVLWKREKQKLIGTIHSREKDIEKQLESTSSEADNTKYRLEKRIEELQNKLRKEHVRNTTKSTIPASEGLVLRRNLFLKERLYVVAESELKKQQQYYANLFKGLKRDHEIAKAAHMELFAEGNNAIETAILEEPKSAKTFSDRLNRIVKAIFAGKVTELRSSLPAHYLGYELNKGNKEKPKPTAEKKNKTDFIVKLSPEEEANLDRTDLGSSLIKWRLSETENVPTLGKLLRDIQKEHPTFIDEKGKLKIKEVSNYFPTISQEKITHYFSLFSMWDDNGDFSLDTTEILHNLPGILGYLSTTEEVADAVREIDIDESGTIDFYEFLLLIKLLQDGEGKSSFFQKNDFLKVSSQLSDSNSKICAIQ